MNDETKLLDKLIPIIDEMPHCKIVESGSLLIRADKYNQAIELINEYLTKEQHKNEPKAK